MRETEVNIYLIELFLMLTIFCIFFLPVILVIKRWKDALRKIGDFSRPIVELILGVILIILPFLEEKIKGEEE